MAPTEIDSRGSHTTATATDDFPALPSSGARKPADAKSQAYEAEAARETTPPPPGLSHTENVEHDEEWQKEGSGFWEQEQEQTADRAAQSSLPFQASAGQKKAPEDELREW